MYWNLHSSDAQRDEAQRQRVISDIDSELGRLLAATRGSASDLLVAVTSQHGMEPAFGTGASGHGLGGHGLYEGNLAVPLIVWGPGRVDVGRTLAGPAMLVDVYPTLLALAGLPAVSGLMGQNLFEPIDAGRPVWAESEHIFARAVIEPRHKLVEYLRDYTDHRAALWGAESRWGYRPSAEQADFFVCRPAGARELYDRLADPREAHNLADEQPREVERLHTRAEAWQAGRVERLIPGAPPGAPPGTSPGAPTGIPSSQPSSAPQRQFLQRHGYF